MRPLATRRCLAPLLALLALAGCATTPSPVGRHPLFPLRAGAHWVYRAAGVAAAEVRAVERTVAVGEWVVGRIQVSAPYGVRPLWVATGPDGVRFLPGEPESPPTSTAISAAPLFLPSAAAVRAGAAWQYRGLVPFALSAGEDPLTAGPPPEMTAELTTTGEEVVAIAGQTYSTVRIELRGRHDVGREMRTEEVLWFASGVGLVQHRAQVGKQSPVVWQLVETQGFTP